MALRGLSPPPPGRASTPRCCMLIARRGDNGGTLLGSATLSVKSLSVDEGDSLLPFSCRETKDFMRVVICRGDIQQWARSSYQLFDFISSRLDLINFTFQKPQ